MKKKKQDLDILISDYNHQIEKIMLDTDSAKQKLDRIRKMLESGEQASESIQTPQELNKNSNFLSRMVYNIRSKMKS